MDVEDVREYCLSKKGTSESFPFDDTTLVFKVASKMFCLMNLNFPQSINLKCAPERAVRLREEYEEIIPGYHMNKTHWNTLELNGSLQPALIKELIDHSYELVVNGLKKSEREKLKNLG